MSRLHLHEGKLLLEWMGSRNFHLVAIEKVQLGSRWAGLLLFIPISGYDVCGDSMLGRRWV